MMTNRSGVRVGMTVVGSDGPPVGKVKQVTDDYFVLDRRLARDLHVPWNAIREVEAGQVVLRIKAEDTNYQNWPSSKLF